MDNLTRAVLAAERLGYGCHYGNYKADYPHTRPAPDDPAGTLPEMPQEIRKCSHCGKPFVRRTNLRRFCSETCKHAHSAQLNLEARRRTIANYPEKVCIYCGKAFHPSKLEQLHCSRSCSAQNKGKNKRISCEIEGGDAR